MLPPLLDKLQKQIDNRQRKDLDVELLLFLDNKRRTVGSKRNDLVSLARGEYLAFVDDDDDVNDNYVDSILEATDSDADVIVFYQKVLLNDDPARTVHFGIEYENQQIAEPGTIATRKPFHCCVWKSSIAKQRKFGDQQWGEDWVWVQEVLTLVKTQYRIPLVLHTYRWSEKVSETISS